MFVGAVFNRDARARAADRGGTSVAVENRNHQNRSHTYRLLRLVRTRSTAARIAARFFSVSVSRSAALSLE